MACEDSVVSKSEIARLRVESKGNRTIENVRVVIVEIDPPVDVEQIIGFSMHCMRRWTAATVDMNPGIPEYFALVRKHGDDTQIMVANSDGDPYYIFHHAERFRIALRASGKDSTSDLLTVDVQREPGGVRLAAV